MRCADSVSAYHHSDDVGLKKDVNYVFSNQFWISCLLETTPDELYRDILCFFALIKFSCLFFHFWMNYSFNHVISTLYRGEGLTVSLSLVQLLLTVKTHRNK